MSRKFSVYVYTDPNDASRGPVVEFLFAKVAKDHARQCVEQGDAYKAVVLNPDGTVVRSFERSAEGSQPPSEDNTPSSAYRSVVADILQDNPRDSDYRPPRPMLLSIRNSRQPQRLEALAPEEQTQLHAILGDRLDPSWLQTALSSDEYCVEVAEVVDDTGTTRYRLYGWNYGVGHLMSASGLVLFASGCQHNMEHWHPDQRPLFYAMDAALRAGGHGFLQPLSFCWWVESCWEDIEDEPSAPYPQQLS